jgi:hypothetical protein
MVPEDMRLPTLKVLGLNWQSRHCCGRQPWPDGCKNGRYYVWRRHIISPMVLRARGLHWAFALPIPLAVTYLDDSDVQGSQRQSSSAVVTFQAWTTVELTTLDLDAAYLESHGPVLRDCALGSYSPSPRGCRVLGRLRWVQGSEEQSPSAVSL